MTYGELWRVYIVKRGYIRDPERRLALSRLHCILQATSLCERRKSATVRHSTTLSYPPIENSFNGCQGHPLVCLPPGTAQRQQNSEEKRLNTQQFIQLTLVDSCRWHKMRKAVEAWKQKRPAYYDMYIMILFTHYGTYFWLELAHAFHTIKTYTNHMQQSACFSLTLDLQLLSEL